MGNSIRNTSAKVVVQGRSWENLESIWRQRHSLLYSIPVPQLCSLITPGFLESTSSICVPTDTFVAFATTIWFPRVYKFHLRIHGHGCCFCNNALVSYSLQVLSAYPRTRLLLLQQRSGFQESTSSICVSMDTFLDFATMLWFPRVYKFHLRIHGHVCCSCNNDLVC
jgi:hypothetical protein